MRFRRFSRSWLAHFVLYAFFSVAFFHSQTPSRKEGVELLRSSGSDDIVVKYSFGQPRVLESPLPGYVRVRLPGLQVLSVPGEPMVPYRSSVVVVPAGKEVGEVRVVPGKKIPVGCFAIEPASEPVPVGCSRRFPEARPKAEVYAAATPFPPAVSSDPVVQFKGGIRLIFVNLYPVEFVPKTKEVSYYEHLTLVVKLRPCPDGQKILPSEFDKEAVRRIVDNPEDVDTYDDSGP